MILTEQNLKPLGILRFLEKRFPKKDWFIIDLYSDEDDTPALKKSTLGFYTQPTHVKDYPVEIHLAEASEKMIAKYEPKIAKALSEKYGMKVVIDFEHPEKEDEHFYSLLYDNGACFLADNSEWESDQKFTIIEAWEEA